MFGGSFYGPPAPGPLVLELAAPRGGLRTPGGIHRGALATPNDSTASISPGSFRSSRTWQAARRPGWAMNTSCTRRAESYIRPEKYPADPPGRRVNAGDGARRRHDGLISRSRFPVFRSASGRVEFPATMEWRNNSRFFPSLLTLSTPTTIPFPTASLPRSFRVSC